MRPIYSRNLVECNMCDNMTEPKNPVRIGFETRYICDDCLDKIKKLFERKQEK